MGYSEGFNYEDPKSVAFLKYLQAVSQLGVFILPAWAYAYLYNRRPVRSLELDRFTSPDLLILSILTIFTCIPLVNYLVQLNEQMALPDFLRGLESWMREMEDETARMTDAFLDVQSVGGLVINLLIIGVFAAIGEEMLFRGVLLKMLNESIRNVHVAVLLSALLFSAFHGQFYGFLPRALLGVLFGYVFIWSGTLWVPILLHLLFNSISVVIAWLYSTGRIATDYSEFGEASALWTVLASAGFSFLLLVAMHRKAQKKGGNFLPPS
jgi:membrane protease YdiL (CAAX protease family)